MKVTGYRSTYSIFAKQVGLPRKLQKSKHGFNSAVKTLATSAAFITCMAAPIWDLGIRTKNNK